jgi:hypothetical protein
MSDTSSTPGEYTDEETPDARDTHRDRVDKGEYEDVELPDGTRAPTHSEEEGEYTDVDRDGDR